MTHFLLDGVVGPETVVVIVVGVEVLLSVLYVVVLLLGCLPKMCPPTVPNCCGYTSIHVLLINLLNLSFCLNLVLLCLNSLILLISKLHCEMFLS